MGYFANGFVFTSEPKFKAISTTVPGRFVRGYKHNVQSIWLLDIWKPRGKLLLRNSPFCDQAADGFRTDTGTVDGPTTTFLKSFQRLNNALGNPNPGREASYIHSALSVTAAASCPTFFWAADDDEIDMGCRTVPGSLVSFGCRLDRLSIRYNDGHATATPMHSVEDHDDDVFEEMIANAKSVPGLTLRQTREVKGGRTLYENPIEFWPKEAGNPAEILGLGTWDPLMNLEADFSVVFEHITQ
jgi:hypothetical protein